MTSEIKRKHACDFCGKEFEKACQIGGHVSRSHAGKSQSYKQKLETRAKRSEIRAIFKEAKDIFFKTTGKEPKNHGREVKKLRDQLRRQRLSGQEKIQNWMKVEIYKATYYAVDRARLSRRET